MRPVLDHYFSLLYAQPQGNLVQQKLAKSTVRRKKKACAAREAKLNNKIAKFMANK